MKRITEEELLKMTDNAKSKEDVYNIFKIAAKNERNALTACKHKKILELTDLQGDGRSLAQELSAKYESAAMNIAQNHSDLLERADFQGNSVAYEGARHRKVAILFLTKHPKILTLANKQHKTVAQVIAEEHLSANPREK